MWDPAAPAPFDRVRDVALIAEVEAHLEAVEAALQRLDDGTYGRCARCGGTIADDRLADQPATVDCGAHGGDGAGAAG